MYTITGTKYRSTKLFQAETLGTAHLYAGILRENGWSVSITLDDDIVIEED